MKRTSTVRNLRTSQDGLYPSTPWSAQRAAQAEKPNQSPSVFDECINAYLREQRRVLAARFLKLAENCRYVAEINTGKGNGMVSIKMIGKSDAFEYAAEMLEGLYK